MSLRSIVCKYQLYLMTFLLFLSNSVISSETYIPKDQFKCEDSGPIENKSKEFEVEEDVRSMNQDNFGGCYGVAGLANLQHEINRNKGPGEDDIHLSISDAFCRGSHYKEGGFTATFLLKLALARTLLPRESQFLSHRDIIACTAMDVSGFLFEDGKAYTNFGELVLQLKKKYPERSVMGKDKETMREVGTIVENASKDYKRHVLPYFQVRNTNCNHKDSCFNEVKSIIDKGSIATIEINRHETNVVGYETHICYTENGEKKEHLFLKMMDPNGPRSTATGLFYADPLLEELTRFRGITNIILRDEEVKNEEIIIGSGDISFFQLETKDRNFIRKLKERGVIDLDAEIFDGERTLLTHSIYRGEEELVEILLENGTDPDKSVEYDFGPLYLAAQLGNPRIVEMLLSYGANINQTTVKKPFPFFNHIEDGRKEIIVPKIQPPGGAFSETPLFVASKNGKNDVVRILLENNADLFIENGDGYNPLHIAVEKGHFEVVETLVTFMKQKGFDINYQTRDGRNALDIAKRKGHHEISRLLEENGAEETEDGSGLESFLPSSILRLIEVFSRNRGHIQLIL